MSSSIIAIYREEKLLLSALRKMNDENIAINDVFTPYPLHEVFKIMNIKTRIPFATFIYAVFGIFISYAFLYWTSVIDYPLVYGGKPLNSIPSFIIITFVTMISLSVLLTVLTFLFRTKLYPGKKPLILDLRITDNAFVIVIDKKPDMSFKEIKRINSILVEYGAIEILEK